MIEEKELLNKIALIAGLINKSKQQNVNHNIRLPHTTYPPVYKSTLYMKKGRNKIVRKTSDYIKSGKNKLIRKEIVENNQKKYLRPELKIRKLSTNKLFQLKSTQTKFVPTRLAINGITFIKSTNGRTLVRSSNERIKHYARFNLL